MSNDRCHHGYQVCSKCIVVDDAARRMTTDINSRLIFTPWDQLIHACMAYRLDDGTTDGTLYPARSVALRYQLRPCGVFYYRNAAAGVNARDMAIWLAMQRAAYESDRVAWVDPESPDIIVSTRGYDHMRGRVRGYG